MMFFLRSLDVRKCVVVVLSLVCIIVITAACGQAQNSEKYGTNLNRGLSGEPESLDPHRGASNQAVTVLRDIGEGLISLGADGTLEPGVARSWNVSDDHLTLTFFLRPDAYWSDGSQILATDFVFAFQRLVEPRTAAPYAEFMSAIVNVSEIVSGEIQPEELGVVALDHLTLQIRLHTPTPHFLELLTHPSTFPLSRSAYLANGKNIFTLKSSLSNGAYILDEWVVGSSITLLRNELYWDNQSTYFDKVVYHVVDQGIEYDRYRAGDLDITANVPESIFSTIKKERPDELRVSPYLGVYYYGFNLSEAPFSDNLKLRQALSIAIDRKELVDKITGRGEVAAFSWVPPGVNLYDSQVSEFANLDKAEREKLAKRLFAEAGYSAGEKFEFELRYNTSDGHRRIALAIQGMWRKVLGVEAKLANEEFAVFISSVQSKQDTQVFRLSWTGDYNDALSFLQILKSNNASNLTAYSNPDFDNAVTLAEKEANPVARKQQLEHAERIAMADFPLIPLYFYVSKHLIDLSIVGWEDNVMDVHLTKHLSIDQE